MCPDSRLGAWCALALALFAPSLQAQQPAELQAARQAMEAKQYAAAEQLYRKALIQTPSSATVLTDLALSLQLQGRSADAMRYFSLALKQQYVPRLMRCWLRRNAGWGIWMASGPCWREYSARNERIFASSQQSRPAIWISTNRWVRDRLPGALDGKDYRRILLSSSRPVLYSQRPVLCHQAEQGAGSEPFLAALRDASSEGSAGARSAFRRQGSCLPTSTRPQLVRCRGAMAQHPQDIALLYLLSVLSAEQGMRQIEQCDEQFPASPYLEQFHADVLATRDRPTRPRQSTSNSCASIPIYRISVTAWASCARKGKNGRRPRMPSASSLPRIRG